MRAPATGSCRHYARTFFRLMDGSGAVVAPVLHPGDDRVVTAVDTLVSPGVRRWREFFLWWARKVGKDELLAMLVLWHIVADALAGRPRLAGIVARDEAQSDVTGAAIRAQIALHPWLTKRCRVLRNEVVFTEVVTDPNTGGRHKVDHRALILPHDPKGLHSFRFTFIGRNELWSDSDSELSTALVPNPACPNPLICYASYFPPAAYLRPGYPFYDLWQRAKNADPSLFVDYVGGEGASASWNIAPWIGRQWVEDQRRILSAVPSKFQRSILNVEPSGADGDGLIGVEELRAALDMTLTEAEHGAPGVEYTGGLDLGLVEDATALVLTHQDHRGHVVVDLAQTWRGTPTRPVDLTGVELAVLDIAHRFRLK